MHRWSCYIETRRFGRPLALQPGRSFGSLVVLGVRVTFPFALAPLFALRPSATTQPLSPSRLSFIMPSGGSKGGEKGSEKGVFGVFQKSFKNLFRAYFPLFKRILRLMERFCGENFLLPVFVPVRSISIKQEDHLQDAKSTKRAPSPPKEKEELS